MTTEDFRDLALRVLEGTADERDRVRLAEARASDPRLATEWAGLETLWRHTRGLAPALTATRKTPADDAEAPPPAPVDELVARTLRAPAGPRKTAIIATLSVCGLAIAAVFALLLVNPSLNPLVERRSFAAAPGWIDSPRAKLVGHLLPTLKRGSDSSLVVLSPAIATSSRTPTFDWTTEPGKSYTVALARADGSARPFAEARDAHPPLASSAFGPEFSLPVDEPLVVHVYESGKPLTTSTRFFMVRPSTAPRADSPENEFLSALFGSDPSRVGDAWLLWQKLPPKLRESKRGQRVYLVLVARLGWETEFERTAAGL